MKEASFQVPYIDRIRSWATTKAHGGNHSSANRPVAEAQSSSSSSPPHNIHSNHSNHSSSPAPSSSPPPSVPASGNGGSSNGGGGQASGSAGSGGGGSSPGHGGAAGADTTGDGSSPPSPAALPQAPGPGPVVEPALPPGDPDEKKDTSATTTSQKQNLAVRFLRATKTILLHTKLNLMLVFVPIGIIVQELHLSPGIIFAMNALAIVPLAGLLSFATEVVARMFGDAVGALLNITFGNAVELIIFIALVKNEIRIVQASLLGSILSNLLLILGMSFLLGGLRFREQIYNSTVTQMSACLLSLSVISLVLPTAFHASFADNDLADAQSLKISRGTSVVLLLVYGIYLLFQLKSHAYMYESTPQHIIDEEATPGPVAGWLESSSSDDSSSSSSDSEGSGHSRDTVSKRVRRVIRGGRRRKASMISVDTGDAVPTRTSSFGTGDMVAGRDEPPSEESSSRPALVVPPVSAAVDGSEEAVEDDRHQRSKRRHRRYSMRKHGRHHRKRAAPAAVSQDVAAGGGETIQEKPEAALADKAAPAPGQTRRIDFALSETPSDGYGTTESISAKRGFTGLRGMSLRPVAKSLAPTVFVQPPELSIPPVPNGPVPRVRYGIRRTNSLPDRLNQYYRAPGAMMPSQILVRTAASTEASKTTAHHDLSRRSAILLLLVSTGLVALCAEFMVDSINGLVASSSVGEIFIGLIILPIVGNAAEHVTAITVAMKNKMDLAIGVAVGSSIQIALFITPLVVILGWACDREMTLYFTLFETVCLFVSTFIVNFLVLDGRSNYLEGALLCATYVIIGVVAFYYPDVRDASAWGA